MKAHTEKRKKEQTKKRTTAHSIDSSIHKCAYIYLYINSKYKGNGLERERRPASGLRMRRTTAERVLLPHGPIFFLFLFFKSQKVMVQRSTFGYSKEKTTLFRL